MDISSIDKMRILLILIAVTIVGGAIPVGAFDEINSTIFGVAIKGYDTVAYHTQGRAIKGDKKFTHRWNGSRWYFTNADNMALFASDPERYAPQYGGY